MALQRCLTRFILSLLNLVVLITILIIIIQFFLYFISNDLKQNICQIFCRRLINDCFLSSCLNPKCYKLSLIDIIVILSLKLKILSQIFVLIGLISNSFIWKTYLASLILSLPWITFNIYDFSKIS